MTVWLELLLAPLISIAVVLFALRWRGGRWVWMGVGVLGVAVTFGLANELSRRTNGYVLSAMVPLVIVPFFTCELTRVTRLGLLMATLLATGYSGWMEFIGPALARSELAALGTRLNRDGICLQSTEYTCGPAAAVTALGRLGFKAQEGELALLANCSAHTGTDPSDLAAAIEERFGMAGARVEYRPIETLEELRQAGLALTVIRFDETLDHWVTVLKIGEESVEYADPNCGKRTISREEFAGKWEHETIRVWRGR